MQAMKLQKPLWLREKEFGDWEDDDESLTTMTMVMRMAKMTKLTRLVRTTRTLHPSFLSRSVDVSVETS